MTKHKIKRAYEKAGFKVCLLPDEGQDFPVLIRDLQGVRITQDHPRWEEAKAIKV